MASSLTAKMISNNIQCCPKELEFKGFRLFLCLMQSDLNYCNPDIIGGKIIYRQFFTPRFVRNKQQCLQMQRSEK